MSEDFDRVAAALPNYEIGGELGRGGWGVVLAGRHRHLQRDVAIKRLPASFASDPDVRARFVAEARLLASLDHPHIVPIYDFVELDGLCLLVMEKLSGGTVWTRFVRAGLDAETACAIALMTAVGLHHAHGHGITHRDVKPENLLFTGDGRQLKVADFGTAKVLSGARTMATQEGDVVGTPAYMAPEQATGSDVTPATDVYALATTLYEMLTGTLPFPEAESPLAMLYQRVHAAPIPIAEAAPSLPAPLGAVVMSALATDPLDRPPSAEWFAVDVAGCATDAFGSGWFERTGFRAALGARLAAITERPGGPAAPVTPSGRLRPARRTNVVRGTPDVQPSSLVPVADASAPARDDTLRELRLLLSRSESGDAQRLAREIERAQATAHGLQEMELLRRVRAADARLSEPDRAEIERLLGAHGTSAAARVGLAADASSTAVRATALEIAQRWKRREESPMTSRPLRSIASEVVRTCERIVAELPPAG